VDVHIVCKTLEFPMAQKGMLTWRLLRLWHLDVEDMLLGTTFWTYDQMEEQKL